MRWDEQRRAAAFVLKKAAPLLDFDPSAYLDSDDVPELTKALSKVKGTVREDLWAWDYYRMEAATGAEGLAELGRSGPEAVAWAFLRALLSE